MSTTIDQKVVEMRFDNANFENNVKTSMSTLERLKRALKFDGASKGLENIQSTANKVNFSGMTNGIETVNARFSYLQASIQHQLNNIVDSAVNAGKRMVSALTIDPVKSGFQEYETQINAVQTILANTKKEGTNVEIVNEALDELNSYADKTIYNFTEMTRNIGTFTAAGVDLNTSVNAIQGIANLAAVSGSTSQQASTAMYQLSQALAAGKVQLMDWNSVVNAGMGGQVFQDALIRTSELMGTGAKQAIEAYGSFRESLTKGEWLTTEVLTETLNQFAGAYSKADLMAQGFSESQADEIVDMAKTAEEAATKVKTFTQLWDVMKEAAQSGWAQTWRIIIGDFEDAKALFTPLADFFTNIIGKMSDARNNLLEGALSGNPFGKLAEKIETVTSATEKVKAVTEEYGEIVDKVIGGEFGNGQERFDKLAESGYNWAKVQNMVNEKLGDSHRYAEELGETQDNLHDTQQTTIEDLLKMSDAQLEQIGFTSDEIEAFRELQKQSELTGIPIKSLMEDMDQLNGRTLLLNGFKNIGKSIVKIFRAIGLAWRDVFPAATSEQLYNVIAGFHKLTKKLSVSNGTAVNLRYTLQGLFSILHIITTITGGALKLGFTLLNKILEAFDLDILTVTGSIGHAIKVFHDWLFEGNILARFLMFLIDQIPVLVSNIKEGIDNFKLWFELFKENPAIKKFSEALARVQKILVNLSKMSFDEHSITIWLSKLKDALKSLLKTIPGAVKELGKELVNMFDALSGGKITKLKTFLTSCAESPQVAALAEAIGRLSNGFKKLFSFLGTVGGNVWDKAVEIGKNIIEGLQNGLGDGVGGVIDKIIEVATNLINAFCDMLGIHSPSTVAFEWGKNIIQGLINGISFAIGWLTSKITDVAGLISQGISYVTEKIGDGLESIDWSNVLDTVIAGFKKLLPLLPVALAALMVKKLVGFLNTLDDVAGGVGNLFDAFTDIGENLNKVMKAYAFDTRMEGLKKLAIAIAILVGCVAILSFMDKDKLYDALGVVVVLGLVLTGLAFVLNKMSSTEISGGFGKGFNVKGLKTGILGIGLALLALAFVVKIMGNLEPEQMKKGFEGLAKAMIAMGVFLAIVGTIGRFGDLKSVDKIGKMMIKIAIAMGLMIGVIKLIRLLDETDIANGIGFAILFTGFVVAITSVAKSAGNNVSKVGSMVLKLVFALGLMVGVCKLAGSLNEEDMKKGAAFAIAMLVFVGVLVKITKIGKRQQLAKLGGLLMAVSLSLLIMVGVCKLAGMLTSDDITNGIVMVAIVGALICGLVEITKISNEQQMGKVAGTLIAASLAIAILAGVALVLGMIDPTKLLNGVLAVGILGTVLAIMIEMTKDAKSCVGNIIAMAIAVGVMGAIVALLSMIDPTRLFAPTIAMGLLMGMFALIEYNAKNIQASVATLLVMAGAVAALGVILYFLSTLPADKTIVAAIALSATMLAFSGAMRIISGMQALSTGCLITIGVMTLVVAALGGILYLLSGVNPAQSLANIVILGLAVAGLYGLLNLMQGMQGPSIMALAGLVIVTLVVAALAAVLYALRNVDAVNALIMVVAISVFLAAMTGVLYLCAGLSAVAGQAIVGALILVAFIGILGLVVIGLAALAMDVLHGLPQLGKDLSDFMNNVQPFMNGISAVPDGIAGKAGQLLLAIAALTGAEIIGAIGNFISGGYSLSSLGTELGAFMTGVQPFLTGIVNVPDGIAEKAGALFLAIAALTGAEIVEAIGNFISGGNGLSSLGSELGAFMTGVTPFVQGVNSIPEDIVDRVGKLSAAILELTGTNLLDAIASFFSGGNTLNDLGTELKAFGDGMASFVTNSSNIDTAVSSIKKLNDVKDVASDVDLGGLNDIGKDLKKFSDNVAELNIASISTSIIAAKKLVSLLNSMVGLDASGVSNFDIKPIGKALDKYSSSVEDLNSGKISASVTVANRLKTFINGLTGMDPSGIANFNPKSIGKSLKDYSGYVSDINTGAISSSISAATKLKNFINSLAGLDTSGVSAFKAAISSLGKVNLEEAAKALSGSTSKFSSVGTKLIESLTKGIKSKSSDAKSAITSLVSSMVKTINSKQGSFKSAGSSLMTKLASGIQSRRGSVSSAVKSTISGATGNIRSEYNSFYNAGSYLVSGFTIGIRNSSYLASIAAASMASAAAAAARKALKINSPSKIFKAIGSSVPEGFALGIGMLGSMVKNSVTDMTNSAINSTSNAIAKVYDLVNSDIDTQPTIRPIVDLADVESGVGAINGMFSDSISLGTSTNIGAISSMMSQRNQNGLNGDVVSAINKLRKDLGNVKGNTYTVNGVTYDDGSNVSRAVEDLVRATIIERRR